MSSSLEGDSAPNVETQQDPPQASRRAGCWPSGQSSKEHDRKSPSEEELTEATDVGKGVVFGTRQPQETESTIASTTDNATPAPPPQVPPQPEPSVRRKRAPGCLARLSRLFSHKKKPKPTSRFELLPVELLLIIMQLLPPDDLGRLRQSSKRIDDIFFSHFLTFAHRWMGDSYPLGIIYEALIKHNGLIPAVHFFRCLPDFYDLRPGALELDISSARARSMYTTWTQVCALSKKLNCTREGIYFWHIIRSIYPSRDKEHTRSLSSLLDVAFKFPIPTRFWAKPTIINLQQNVYYMRRMGVVADILYEINPRTSKLYTSTYPGCRFEVSMAMLDWPQCDSETSTCAISRAHAFVCGTDKERKRFYRRYYNLCLEHCRHRA